MSGTEALYLTDSYLRTCNARVISRDEHSVVLDRTVFFPRGGGQMADRGLLIWEKQRIPVIAVEKRGDDIVHTLDGPMPPAESEVACEIDWDFRYTMMRTHSALHVLCGVIYEAYRSQVTGCQMYPDRARMDFTLADLTPDRVGDIERRANRAIDEGYPIRVRFLPRAKANQMPELIRTKINLVPAHIDPIRTVDIVGLDVQADGGTHVANTLEIGGIRITKTENKGRENRRLEIQLLPQAE